MDFHVLKKPLWITALTAAVLIDAFLFFSWVQYRWIGHKLSVPMISLPLDLTRTGESALAFKRPGVPFSDYVIYLSGNSVARLESLLAAKNTTVEMAAFDPAGREIVREKLEFKDGYQLAPNEKVPAVYRRSSAIPCKEGVLKIQIKHQAVAGEKPLPCVLAIQPYFEFLNLIQWLNGIFLIVCLVSTGIFAIFCFRAWRQGPQRASEL